MNAGLTIKVVDPDTEYLGIEIRAANQRYSGMTQIYAGLDELSSFATQIAGFPAMPGDNKVYEFGRRDRSIAGGYCRLHFRCLDQLGHAAVEVTIEDDGGRYPPGNAEFTFRFEPAALDRFVKRLHELDQERFGEAHLPLASK